MDSGFWFFMWSAKVVSNLVEAITILLLYE